MGFSPGLVFTERATWFGPHVPTKNLLVSLYKEFVQLLIILLPLFINVMCQISPKDIRWDSSGQGRSFIRCLARGGGVIGPVRGRGKGRPKKNFRPQFGKNGTEIKLSNTKAIIKKVTKVLFFQE